MTITKVVARLNVKFRHGVMELNSMACLPSPNSKIAIMTTNKPKNHNKNKDMAVAEWPSSRRPPPLWADGQYSVQSATKRNRKGKEKQKKTRRRYIHFKVLGESLNWWSVLWSAQFQLRHSQKKNTKTWLAFFCSREQVLGGVMPMSFHPTTTKGKVGHNKTDTHTTEKQKNVGNNFTTCLTCCTVQPTPFLLLLLLLTLWENILYSGAKVATETAPH